MKRFFLTVFLSFFYLAIIFAQGNLYTLKKCIETGLEKNYSIRIIQNQEQISSNNATLGNAGYLPTIDLSGGFNGSLYDYNYEAFDGTTEKVKNVNSEIGRASCRERV